jgi:hypothetical protein
MPFRQAFNYTIAGNVIEVKALPKTPAVELQSTVIPIAFDLTPSRDVSGRVVDETDKPVIASVVVKGTQKGVTTNENGVFEIKECR